MRVTVYVQGTEKLLTVCVAYRRAFESICKVLKGIWHSIYVVYIRVFGTFCAFGEDKRRDISDPAQWTFALFVARGSLESSRFA